MSPRGLPHMYSASLYNIGRDCMEIHAASPDVPFNRGGVMLICHCPGWVAGADHVAAPRGMSIVGHDSRGVNVKTRQAAPVIVSEFL